MVKLQKLWSVEMYEKMMKQINLYRLIETPYMMEIIVQVLPKMMVKASDIINLRLNFLQNFPNMLHEFYKSNYLIQMYNWQSKMYIQQGNHEKKQWDKEIQDNDEKELQDNKKKEIYDNNENEQQDKNKIVQQDNDEKQQQDNKDKELQEKNDNEQQDKNNENEQQHSNEKEQSNNNEQQQQVTQTDVENLDKINYISIANEIWNKMEEHSIASQFFNSQELDDHNKNLLFGHYLKHFKNEFTKFSIEKDRMIEVVCNALSELNLTSYDFYDEFINQKQRNLGKSILIDRFLHDLNKYSINLAKVMSTKQMTQVQYQQQGFLYQEEKEEEKWQNEFFNDDDCQFGSYKKDLRSCSLVQQKGINFQFVHKSLQEFFIAAHLYGILELFKNFQGLIFNQILKQLSKGNNYDQNFVEYLQNQMDQQNLIIGEVSISNEKKKILNKLLKFLIFQQ